MVVKNKKAVVLLSGGLDSATVLAMAQHEGYECYALSFCYGQRHDAELKAAERIAADMQVQQHHIFDIDLTIFDNSALTNRELSVPTTMTDDIPITYVPARNTIFLSVALGWAEVLNADAIFTGVNALDYSGYPDCRPEFISAFQAMANLATKVGVEHKSVTIKTPLIDLTKAQIIHAGLQLGIDYSLTVSCYQATQDGLACGKCDSCQLRRQGFMQAGVEDPTLYH